MGAAADTSIVREGDLLAGKYRVEKVLGVGGMGVVVAATHIELDQRVALKFLLPEMLESAEAIERFLREARSAVKLKSDHVAKVLDVGKLESGAPYIVMEYLEGNDLSHMIETFGALATDIAVDYVLQACEAIAEAHALGIVHRDLKPQNLFLTKRVYGAALVKVLDFGISKAITSAKATDLALTKTGIVMGSPLYMSPEQMKSGRGVDARSDIWSLGVILYQLLTARLPFEAETVPHLCAIIMTESPKPIREVRRDLPEGIDVVIRRCLEKSVDQRYQNIAELAHALEKFAPPSSRGAAERISSVLRVKLTPQMMATAAATSSIQSSASSTSLPSPAVTDAAILQSKTSVAWGETKAPRGEASGKGKLVVGVIAGIAIGAIAIGVVAIRGAKERDDRPAPTAVAAQPTTPATATVASHAETTTVAPITPPAPTTVTTMTTTTTTTTVASATATTKPGKPGLALTGKLPAKPSASTTVATTPPIASTQKPATPTPPPPTPTDMWGDRK